MLGLVSEFPNVFEELRGSGLMLGIKTKIENITFTNEAFEQNLLLVPASDNVVRLLPPINLTLTECDEAIDKIRATCSEFK